MFQEILELHWLLIMGTYIWDTIAPSNSGKMQEGRETWDLRRGITSLDRVLKSRDITLLTKVCMVKAMVFPVVMYGYENWTLKKAGRWRIDAFKLWCWRRFLRAPWTAKRSNLLILKEINLHSLEGLMLKPQYFGHLMGKTDSLETMLGKIEGRQRRSWQGLRWLDGITESPLQHWKSLCFTNYREMVQLSENNHNSHT